LLVGAVVFLTVAGCDLFSSDGEGESPPEEDVVACTDGTATDSTGTSYPCQNVDLLARLAIPDLGGAPAEPGKARAELNDLWGWTDPQTDRRYALVGRTDGLAFVDVTEPTDPVFLGSLPNAADSPSSWRDVKVKNDHALVVSEAAGHGMQIFDLTELRDATGEDAPQPFAATAVYEGFGRAHNVVPAGEGTARAYGVGLAGRQSGAPSGASCGAGYHGVDLSDPAAPQFAGCFNSDLGGRVASGYTHDAQCVTYDGPDSEYEGREICLGADETGLSVADLTDLSDPQQIATATYPQTGYTHQGWFSENQRYFYLDDEQDEQAGLVDETRTLVWDLQDLDHPVLATQHAGATTAIDHNQYLNGGLAYQANYTSGLRILDASSPEEPTEVGYFDVYPQNNEARFQGAWSVYPFFEEGGPLLVSGIGSGLFVLRATGEAAR
jgi:choice-of-anchor B domain-containing protein